MSKLKNARAWLVIENTVSGKTFNRVGLRGPACNNPGQWNFFGGNVDPGETYEEALVRELFEETGMLVQAKDLVLLFKENVKTSKGNTKPCAWYSVDYSKVNVTGIRFTPEVSDYDWLDMSWVGRTDLHYSVASWFSWRLMKDHEHLVDGNGALAQCKAKGFL